MQNNANSGSSIQGAFQSEKIFDGKTFVVSKLNVLDARILMGRIGKVLGGPFIKFFGAGDESVEGTELDFDIFASALNSVNPKESVEIIKDLCEITINQSEGRPTKYVTDFSPDKTTDLEVAFWVAEYQFGNFFKALGKSNLGAQALQVIQPSEPN